MSNVITPSQVFEAIEYAKSIDSDDNLGIGAFQVKIKNERPANNNVRYYPFEILKKDAKGNWSFVPLVLKFKNLVVKNKILAPDSPDRKFPGVNFTFDNDTKFTTDTGKKDKDGNPIIIDEPYSAAKIAIDTIFRHLIKKLLNEEKIYNANHKTSTSVQIECADKDIKGKKNKLDNPIVRMEIKFEDKKAKENKSKENPTKNASAGNRTISSDAVPLCAIYDVEKRIPNSSPKYKPNGFNFEYLQYVSEKDNKKYPITYENIGKVILPGSIISGTEDLSSVACSNLGISLPSKISILIVKKSTGYSRNDPAAVFSEGDIKSFTDFDDSNETDETSEEKVITDKFEELDDALDDALNLPTKNVKKNVDKNETKGTGKNVAKTVKNQKKNTDEEVKPSKSNKKIKEEPKPIKSSKKKIEEDEENENENEDEDENDSGKENNENEVEDEDEKEEEEEEEEEPKPIKKPIKKQTKKATQPRASKKKIEEDEEDIDIDDF